MKKCSIEALLGQTISAIDDLGDFILIETEQDILFMLYAVSDGHRLELITKDEDDGDELYSELDFRKD